MQLYQDPIGMQQKIPEYKFHCNDRCLILFNRQIPARSLYFGLGKFIQYYHVI